MFKKLFLLILVSFSLPAHAGEESSPNNGNRFDDGSFFTFEAPEGWRSIYTDFGKPNGAGFQLVSSECNDECLRNKQGDRTIFLTRVNLSKGEELVTPTCKGHWKDITSEFNITGLVCQVEDNKNNPITVRLRLADNKQVTMVAILTSKEAQIPGKEALRSIINSIKYHEK